MMRSPLARDPHALYEASVQGVEYDLDFLTRVYRHHHGANFRDFREDFCGTAQLACAWVLRDPRHRAWAVDLDREPFAWTARHRLPLMREAADRLTFVHRDVRRVTAPRVDVVAAMNFSYWVFKERDALRDYFRAVHRSLRPGGLFFATLFGGTEAMGTLVEKRRIAASQGPDGGRMPAFGYEWEQARFNPIDHHLLCHIHFVLADGTRMPRAFTYDWRLWTLPEVREVMREAGFPVTDAYVEGWDDAAGRSDGVYRRRTRFENQEGWLAYVVGRA